MANEREPVERVRIIGYTWSHEVRDFLARSRIPSCWRKSLITSKRGGKMGTAMIRDTEPRAGNEYGMSGRFLCLPVQGPTAKPHERAASEVYKGQLLAHPLMRAANPRRLSLNP